MTTPSSNPFTGIIIRESADDGSDFSNPASDYRRLYLGEDGALHLKDSTGTVTDIGGAGGTAATTTFDPSGLINTDATDVQEALADHDAAIAAAGGGDDIIAAKFGTPDIAFEFSTSSLAGLTAVGTPDTEDADTTVPDCYYIADNAAGDAWCGRFVGSLTPPFTVIGLVLDSTTLDQYNGVGIFAGVANPTAGALLVIAFNSSGGFKVQAQKWTNPTTYSAQPGTVTLTYRPIPMYLAIVVNSSTDVDFHYSYSGLVWRKLADAYNPGVTIASAGLVAKSSSALGHAAAWDYLRIWNSALTIPGI